ncbi:hemolysin III [Peptoclostridium litorale DSM 5388]|uniref:Hemolysin-3 n=1 Tax=Peptoclostridium litorale DSM 5388 TaxID=1121324 RepID=A0A069RIC9_PEPLI|nr:hemolysin III family protein [Peptoclostridium litorale]KDR96766.1 hemolysin-3 [Peptoclostridium litorale DSM 5388]SIO34647.1 hemolysin III [Peptoclostridium litorale DSM 5388]
MGELLSRRYSFKEEIANSITHGVGVIFSIVALTMLLVYAILQRRAISIVGFSIYGICSISLYLASTLYHSFKNEKAKRILRIFDHSSIYLFIAGTYTPVALLSMKGYWRIGILSGVWAIAILGILFKVFTYKKIDKYKAFSIALYIVMGWIVVIAVKPMIENVPIGFFMWLLAGGIVYTVGTVFYAIKKIPYNHAIWHLFVLAGSVLHFLGIFIYLA